MTQAPTQTSPERPAFSATPQLIGAEQEDPKDNVEQSQRGIFASDHSNTTWAY